MRILGLAGLVLALLVVGLLARKQMLGNPVAAKPGAIATELDARARSRQVQQDVQRSLDAAMRAPRSVPDEP